MEGTLSPTEYEQLVHGLVDGFGIAFGAGSLRGGKKNLILGASGFRHQIDVSIHLPDKIVLMECKLLRRPVEVHHALTLAARLQDIREANPSKTVTASLVSTSSVRVGAFKIAEHFGFSIDQVMTLQDYAVTILESHYVGVSSGIKIGDSCEALVTANNSFKPKPLRGSA